MSKTNATELMRQTGDTSWFVHDRLGLFIHWGPYSLAARHEWLRNTEGIPAGVHEKRYFDKFDPDLYDPDAWAGAAADAGMKYFIVTTKYHEGFCLWDSKLTDYKAPRTPAGRDLLRPMVEAFRRRGLRVGLYHSLLDWHHPDFIQDPAVDPDRGKANAGRDRKRYVKHLHGQVDELLTGYGDIDILWLDFGYPKPDGPGKGHLDWDSENLLRLVRERMPKAIVDDRLDRWDVKTPEQARGPRQGVTVDGKPVVWEACRTLSDSWVYHRDEKDWRSTEQLVQTLIDCVSKDGNLLLNVGPTARGEFDDRAMDRLRGIGRWMRRHSRSIYGCGPAPSEFVCPRDCRLTYNAAKKRIYVHILAWPYKTLHLDGALRERVEYAQLLSDASEVRISTDWALHHSGVDPEKTLTLGLPQERPAETVPVVELFLKPEEQP
jgi:alpha-L-fucosidase